jgi:hypothetical protein
MAVAELPASGGPATTSTRARKRRGTRMRSGQPADVAPRWLHMLAHMPRSAIGTTGTARRARILSTPDLNGPISPSRVSVPSGNTPTIWPSASAASIASNARCNSTGSSRAPAIGIARAVRKIQRSTGMLKMRWYMTKRTGRGMLAARISASM